MPEEMMLVHDLHPRRASEILILQDLVEVALGDESCPLEARRATFDFANDAAITS
jgi:hypothetical protein